MFLASLTLSACGSGGDGDNDSPPEINGFSAAPDSTDTATPIMFCWNVSDKDGDILTCQLDVDGDGTDDYTINDCASNSVQAHTFTSTGIFTSRLTTEDGNGSSDQDTVSVTILGNEPPTITSTPVTTGSENTLYSYDVEATDPNTGNTLSFSLDIAPAGMTIDTASGLIQWTPSGAQTGNNNVTVRVTDNGTVPLSDTQSFTIAVAGPVGSSSNYLFYSNDLSAVDPANPAAPIFIENREDVVSGFGGFNATAELILTGNFNGSTNVVTDLSGYSLIYAKTDGRLYRVDAAKSGSLTPVQVSSESQADQLCVGAMNGSAHRDDLADPEQSQFLYALPGTDNICETDDDLWKMVRIGMNASDAPVTAKKPVDSITNTATGAISGWLGCKWS